MHVRKLPTHGAFVDSILGLDFRHELAGNMARLPHLDTLKLAFESLEQMETFVRVVHLVLQEICTTGPTIEFGVKTHRYFDSAMWEPASAIFERFAYVILTRCILL